ncbi:hypothetical protein ACP4OV_019177 [Aristida adscensionis]
MKRTKKISSYFSPAPTPVVHSNQPLPVQSEHVESETTEIEANPEHVPHVVPTEIVADPGLQIPIEQIDPNIRDAAKRSYVSGSLPTNRSSFS